MNTHFALRSLAAATLGFAALAAQAADFSFSGQFSHNTDVVQIDFSLSSAQTITLFTDSWQSGLNFDPTLGLYNAQHAWLQTIDDNDGSFAGPGYFDAGAVLTSFAAGHYRLTLSLAGNDPIAGANSIGFTLDGSTPVALADWVQASSNINTGDQKGGYWSLHLNGVDHAAIAAVPEPGSVALMLAGLAGLMLGQRQRRGA
ncbi:PEP-CTERM sorting domain-containing protein [Paucibacter sp. DJ1R-11]|uniref:PEP-CTERM sorting domain-containing protein n=1 Tax=Paucibacter sp. DJ1R-11 TaxID=2893556 RepID=UPI0021E4AAE7|nr:PEP-CTERM sorting domain-containing protein [Paucibacter sp. DJ1R-11]MCV2362037.1 PEP-CTERM sorting domain-containing protein [Paucibacter sp. DJ1R-11]